ncbi:tetratricopeptide repeat protein [Gluconacetobacter sacchari]|uniref:Tetratricopeptide repeat protein n=1 Tax=Gluconacetobacter sacchari TaxID=92759 RepID=A0A7W4IDM4_9PROT|nr:tetratricopeptide repeat protein [Gluconacetobacter sacchari]
MLLTLLAGLSPLAVRAQDSDQMTSREGIALQNQIMDLRQQLSQMQSAMPGPQAPGVLPPPSPSAGGNGGSPVAGGGDLTAQLLDRVMTLEQQVRDMRGQLDQLTNQVQQQNATLAKQIDDMNFAMQNGGHPAARPAAADAPAVGGGDEDGAPAPAARRTPETVLHDGNAALMHGDYAGAQAAAKQVLAGPRGPLQIDAQFLLAQSLAGQKQYRQSAVAYYDTYNRSPRSGRAPDALLGVAASLLAMGDKNSACQALAKLKSEFPSPAPRVKTAEAAYRTRAACH